MTVSQHPIYNDVDVAKQLHLTTGGSIAWEDLDPDVRRDFLIRACQIVNQRQTDAREEEARRVKYAAADAYRVSIAGTVPAHRLDTRQNGFLDGWDAALAHAAQQAS